MDEPTVAETRNSTEEDRDDVVGTPDEDEVEGRSMAISANLAIDIGGVALPGAVAEKDRLAARDGSAPSAQRRGPEQRRVQHRAHPRPHRRRHHPGPGTGLPGQRRLLHPGHRRAVC